jgi:hypothetical protein
MPKLSRFICVALLSAFIVYAMWGIGLHLVWNP